jgi:flavin reductase (DIM6/NTAB) family NADH-FMN oxidoreductase RutF
LSILYIKMITINPKELPVMKLQLMLQGAVAPRPVAFASTIDEEGRVNLSPFSFFNIFSANPPILIFSPARRGRDNTTKHTFENVKKVSECVINIVNYDMVQQTSLASVEYPEGVNEFVKAGFTELPSEIVKPPRVAESPVQFECRVNQIIELGTEGGAGNLVICEVLRMHIDEKVIGENGLIDPFKIDQVARLGGDWYTRASQGLFEVAKPNQKMGIGVDQIPSDVRLSSILSGNHLGQLGNVEVLPDETSVNEYKLTELAEIFIELEDNAAALEQALHQRAAELLNAGNVHEAWLTLLAFNN